MFNKMKKFYSILSVLTLAVLMCSCVSTKKIVYFQGADSLYTQAQQVLQQYEMKLKKEKEKGGAAHGQ